MIFFFFFFFAMDLTCDKSKNEPRNYTITERRGMEGKDGG
jgi:hypothetical protein